MLVGATVQFLIKDPIASKGVVQDLNHSMRVLAQTTLVNILMTLKLVEIQNDRKFIGIRAQVDTIYTYSHTTPFFGDTVVVYSSSVRLSTKLSQGCCTTRRYQDLFALTVPSSCDKSRRSCFRTFCDQLIVKETIFIFLQDELNKATKSWGVQIDRIEM